MIRRLTEELLNELINSAQLDKYLKQSHFDSLDLCQYLNELLEEKGLKRSEVVKKAGLNEVFGYQIFKGSRGASRDTLLRLAFAMKLNLKETNRLLQAGGLNYLYPKNRRDAIIIFCLENDCSLYETDCELLRLKERCITKE
ncbi:MAG: helix-turn-helix transcriptional regulator [Enterococcus sp.]|nr:helix-turn-helix transcriptional regulator [Enterococcus sp.]